MRKPHEIAPCGLFFFYFFPIRNSRFRIGTHSFGLFQITTFMSHLRAPAFFVRSMICRGREKVRRHLRLVMRKASPSTMTSASPSVTSFETP